MGCGGGQVRTRSSHVDQICPDKVSKRGLERVSLEPLERRQAVRNAGARQRGCNKAEKAVCNARLEGRGEHRELAVLFCERCQRHRLLDTSEQRWLRGKSKRDIQSAFTHGKRRRGRAGGRARARASGRAGGGRRWWVLLGRSGNAPSGRGQHTPRLPAKCGATRHPPPGRSRRVRMARHTCRVRKGTVAHHLLVQIGGLAAKTPRALAGVRNESI